MHQSEKTYQLEIIIKKTKCPICNQYHLHMSPSGVITCECGFICDNLHSYVAGVHLNNDLDFYVYKIYKK